MAENSINMDEMISECFSKIEETIRNLKKLNIIVVGKTGVGKSTLINSVFKEKLAETGIGRPVTRHMTRLSKDSIPLTIYDTRGLELDEQVQNEIKKEILTTIADCASKKDVGEAIHCIWYCINTATNRVEETEIEWLKEFTEQNKVTNVPVIVVLTQAFNKKNADILKNRIKDENLHIDQVVPVLAMDYEINEEYTVKSHGLDTLIKIMGEVLPESLKNSLQNVQIASLEEKKKRAQIAVKTAVAAAFGEGFAPIPFSDAALLIPTQFAMIGAITAIFGLEITKSCLTGFLSATVGAAGATFAGKTIVANLLKLIPVAGTTLGGMISGTTAALLTTALGEAYILLMGKLYMGEITQEELVGESGQKILKELFDKYLKSNK